MAQSIQGAASSASPYLDTGSSAQAPVTANTLPASQGDSAVIASLSGLGTDGSGTYDSRAQRISALQQEAAQNPPDFQAQLQAFELQDTNNLAAAAGHYKPNARDEQLFGDAAKATETLMHDPSVTDADKQKNLDFFKNRVDNRANLLDTLGVPDTFTADDQTALDAAQGRFASNPQDQTSRAQADIGQAYKDETAAEKLGYHPDSSEEKEFGAKQHSASDQLQKLTADSSTHPENAQANQVKEKAVVDALEGEIQKHESRWKS